MEFFYVFRPYTRVFNLRIHSDIGLPNKLVELNMEGVGEFVARNHFRVVPTLGIRLNFSRRTFARYIRNKKKIGTERRKPR